MIALLNPNTDADVLLVQIALGVVALRSRDGKDGVVTVPPPQPYMVPNCALGFVEGRGGGFSLQPVDQVLRLPCPEEPAKLWAFAVVLARAGSGRLIVTARDMDNMPAGSLWYAVDDASARIAWKMA